MSIFEQILKLLLDLVIAGLTFLFEFIEQLVSGVPKRKRQFNAEFVSVGSLLSSSSSGFCLDGKRSLSVKNSRMNGLVIGGTGMGKSSIVLIPTLFRMDSSFVVHDPSGELYSKTSGYLKARGYIPLVLNFANPDVSCGYNPLARAKTKSEIAKVASLLVRTSLGGENKDNFWNSQAATQMAMLINILKKQDPAYQNLFNVRQLLNQIGGNPEAVDSLFTRFADEVLFTEYKSLVSYDAKVISGITATSKSALQIWGDDAVARVTSFDTLNFQDFRDKRIALFIQNSVADQKYYSVFPCPFVV